MNRSPSPLLQFAAAAVVMALTLAGYVLWHDRISTLSARVASIETRIRIASETSLRLASARAALAQLSGDEAAVQAYFVPESQVVAFIDALEASGKTLGAKVSVVSVSSADAGERPTLLVALSITGSFDAIMRTVGALEFSPYDVTITNLSVAADKTTGWSAHLGLSVGSIAAAAVSTAPASALVSRMQRFTSIP